jgi:hypothetical protein
MPMPCPAYEKRGFHTVCFGGYSSTSRRKESRVVHIQFSGHVNINAKMHELTIIDQAEVHEMEVVCQDAGSYKMVDGSREWERDS